MLQSASDWWWGANPNESKENKTDEKDEKCENKEDKNNDTVGIEFDKELDSVSCLDLIVSLFKLIDFENAIKNLLTKQFDNKLTEKENNGILLLFNKIYNIGIPTNWHLSIYLELKIGEIILSYFASLSPTNPNAFSCWQRWIKYRGNKEISQCLKSVSKCDLEKFYATQANEIGFDNNRRLIWFISTEKYDGFIDDNTQRKAVILLMQSFYWNLTENKFDLHTLRNGVFSHLNLSQWRINMISWSTVCAIKDGMVAYPYALKQIYILNPPMFIYLVKTAAAQFFSSHALDKFIFLENQQEFFTKYADKDEIPLIAQGTSKQNVTHWMKERGYI